MKPPDPINHRDRTGEPHRITVIHTALAAILSGASKAIVDWLIRVAAN